ncbi:hypothetical protein Tco_0417473 [Tanacetum coccineum]
MPRAERFHLRGDNRTCTIKGTGKVKIQLYDGSSFILEDVKYVLGLRRSLISLGTLEKEDYMVKMQMGRIKESMEYRLKNVFVFRWNCKRAQGDREAGVFHVSNDDAAVAQRRLEDKQLEEKINTNYLVKEQEKGNIAEKKKVEESIKANIGKLLKYNAWSTRRSPVRGSSIRKRC